MTTFYAAISPADKTTVLEILELPDNLRPGVDIGVPDWAYVRCQQGTPFPSTYANGVFTPLAVAASLPLPIYLDRKMALKLQAGITVNVGTTEAPVNVLVDGTTDTKADVGGLASDGLANPTETGTWWANDGTQTVLTGAQFVILGRALKAWVANMVAIEASTDAAIASGAITSTAQIDAIAWPTS